MGRQAKFKAARATARMAGAEPREYAGVLLKGKRSQEYETATSLALVQQAARTRARRRNGIGTAPNLAMDEPAPEGIYGFEISYGIPVVTDPTRPEGTIEFRNADGEVVGTMENVKP